MATEDPVDGRSAAYRRGVESLVLAVTAAADGEADRALRISAGLRTALEALAGEPELAHLLLVEPLTASSPLRREYERALARLATALRPPAEPAVAPEVAEERARLTAAGLVSYLSGRVVAGEAADLRASHGLLLEYLLTGTDPGRGGTGGRSA